MPSLAGLDLGAVAASRWFAAKGRALTRVTPIAALEPAGAPGAALVLAELEDDGGTVDRYALPLSWSDGAPHEADATDPLWPALAAAAAGPGVRVPPGPGRVLSTDQSNAAVVLGEELVVKVIRLVDPGPSPEAQALAALEGLDGVPALRGAIELEGATIVVLQELVPAVESGWEPAIESLVEVAAGRGAEPQLDRARSLGALAGRVHALLAERLGAEPASASVLHERRVGAEAGLEQLRRSGRPEVVDALRGTTDRLIRDLAAFERCAGTPLARIHGDLHLGQVLWRADGSPAIVDFDGEPGRPARERLARWTPVRDVASLLLSFDNAAAAARRRCAARGIDSAALTPFVDAARAAVLAAWEREWDASRPVDGDLLRACFAEKQIAELAYADRFLPEWLYAPLAVLRLRFGDDE